MTKLIVGAISNKELAEWFGIASNSLSKNKKTKLKELESFAKFHIENGGRVIIDEVYNDTYCKKGSDTFKKVKAKVNEVWNADGLDTCARVGEEIYEVLSEENKNFSLAPSTIYKYTREGRNELYGKPFMGGGPLGKCSYLWCKKQEDGSFALLTEEEQKIKQELQTKYFGDATEKQVLVKAMVEAGEITSEEAWGVLQEMTNMDTNFYSFLQELQKRIGCKVIRGTLVERLESAF